MTRVLSCSTVTSASSGRRPDEGRLRPPHSQAATWTSPVQLWSGLCAPCGPVSAPREAMISLAMIVIVTPPRPDGRGS